MPGIVVHYGAIIQDGSCPDCGAFLEQPTKEDKEGRQKAKLLKRLCPQCQEHKEGKLIVRIASVRPPSPPDCIGLSCIFGYMKDALTFVFMASYQSRRINYAMAHRDNSILERYRTGEPSPQTLWQAIHANWKLACPLCRKYNIDPLLSI